MCPASSVLSPSNHHCPLSDLWPVPIMAILFLCLFVSMHPMRLNEAVGKMERYVLPPVKGNDV